LPAIFLHVDFSGDDGNVFHHKPIALLLIRTAVFVERDIARRSNYAVPGHIMTVRKLAKRIADLSGTARNAGYLRNLSVVRNTAFRDVTDRVPDSMQACESIQNASPAQDVPGSHAWHHAALYRGPGCRESV